MVVKENTIIISKTRFLHWCGIYTFFTRIRQTVILSYWIWQTFLQKSGKISNSIPLVLSLSTSLALSPQYYNETNPSLSPACMLFPPLNVCLHSLSANITVLQLSAPEREFPQICKLTAMSPSFKSTDVYIFLNTQSCLLKCHLP